MKSLLLSMTIVMCASGLFAQTEVCGTIDGEIWTQAGSPYVLTCDLTIASLDIQSGVTVTSNGNYQISIAGYMNAMGTEAEPIIFTKPDSVASWRGILINEVTTLQSQFKYCTIEKSSNRGLRIFDSVPPIMENCTITNNSGSTGGGIYVENTTLLGSTFTVKACTLSSNTCTGNGGAMTVNLTGGTLIIEGSTFTGNTANISNTNDNYVGGALYLTNGDADISHSTFASNRSNSRCSNTFDCGVTARGGAIYIGGGSVAITHCDFDANRTHATNAGNCFFGGYTYSYGAAVYINAGSVTLSNCLLRHNTTTWTNCNPDDGGAGVYVNGGSAHLINCTVVDNSDATGVRRAAGSLSVENSILFFNNSNGAQIAGSVTATYTDVQNGYTGEGNIAGHPIFIDGEYHLSPVSPCVDAGNPDSTNYDLNFPPSLGTFRNDMGCYGGPNAYDPTLPRITVADIPDDQGGWLTMTWPAFAADDPGAPEPITAYQVQQAPDPFNAPVTTWTTLFEVTATAADSYATDVPTDSTYVVDEWSPNYAYRVVGVTNDPGTEFVSNTNVGLAVDNIVPPVPTLILSDDLTFRMIVMLALDLTNHPDFVESCIFRGGLNVPGQIMHPIEAVLWEDAVDGLGDPKDPCSSTNITDAWWESYRSVFYYIARSKDWHGNWSAASDTIIPTYPTGVKDVAPPLIFELAQNHPNPFNPVTQINFTLPCESPVKLSVYDVSGRLVNTLVDETRPSGIYKVVWKGRDTGGNKVASGIYFYRLDTSTNSATKKMALLK